MLQDLILCIIIAQIGNLAINKDVQKGAKSDLRLGFHWLFNLRDFSNIVIARVVQDGKYNIVSSVI